MAWYAYCIAEQKSLCGDHRPRRPFQLESLRGINGSEVLAFPSGDLIIVVSRYSGSLNQANVVEHSRVVSSCFERGTVLPFRFGTVFDNDEALRRAIRSNKRQFVAGVEQLRGKAEMHLKLVVTDDSLADAMQEIELPKTVGGDYLTTLRVKASRERERQTKARSLSSQVYKMLQPLDEEVTCRKPVSGVKQMTIDIAHLVDQKSLDKYQNRFNIGVSQIKGCEVVMTGPWPPYHFTPTKLKVVGGNS
jgi:hypothetical protein